MSNHHAALKKELESGILSELTTNKIQARSSFKNPLLSAIVVMLNIAMDFLRKIQTSYFKANSAGPSKPDPRALGQNEALLFQEFENRRSRFRELNYYYAVQYSGSYKLNYNLAYLTVALAVSSLFLAYIQTRIPGEHLAHWIHTLIFTFGLLKLMMLLLIFLNTRQANGTEFNQRAIAVRYVMEQLRGMAFLSVVGIREMPGILAGKRSKNTVANYLDDFIMEIVAEVYQNKNKSETKAHEQSREHLISVLQFLKREWVEKQIGYHKHKMNVQEALHERLENLVLRLNASVLLIVILDVLLGLLSYLKWLPAELDKWVHKLITPLILTIATIIPAMVASFNGLKSQSEARKLAERSRSMAELLEILNQEYEALILELAQKEATAQQITELQNKVNALAYETANEMINEVTEWRLIYAREVSEV